MPGGDVTQAGGKEDEGRYMTLYIAISSTILNLAFTLLSIYNQSQALKENFLLYTLNCLKARHNWVPFISLFKNNKIDRNIDYSAI